MELPASASRASPLAASGHGPSSTADELPSKANELSSNGVERGDAATAAGRRAACSVRAPQAA